jgi:regulator of RNase E activity RraB
MASQNAELDQLQNAFKTAVEQWIQAIREEEALASTEHSVADIDRWEQAAFDQQKLGNEVKEAKKRYEDALRREFFNF